MVAFHVWSLGRRHEKHEAQETACFCRKTTPSTEWSASGGPNTYAAWTTNSRRQGAFRCAVVEAVNRVSGAKRLQEVARAEVAGHRVLVLSSAWERNVV